MTTGYDTTAQVKEDVQRARVEFGDMRARAEEIGADFVGLAHREVDLAKAELTEARGHLVVGTASSVVSVVFLFWTIGFVGIALMFGVAGVWPDWAAALVTAAVLLTVGATAALVARGRFKLFDPIPRKTLDSMQEDISWLRRLMKRSTESRHNGP